MLMKTILFITHTISSGGGAERVLNTLIDELSSEYQIDILEWLEDTVSPFKERKQNVNYIGSLALSNKKAKELNCNIRLNQLKHIFLAFINILSPRLLYRKKICKKYDY